MKLDVKAFAITCGLVWGLGVFALAWWVIAWDGPGGPVPVLGQMYRGFTYTPGGSIVGLIWGLADGVALGALLAWLYNRLSGPKAASRAS